MSRRSFRKKPLYRKVNTRTHGVQHGGGEYRWLRNTKSEKIIEQLGGSMHKGKRNGRDYTPLFRFLLSKIGQPWASIHGEATSRLDSDEPIFWMVARTEDERSATVRVGESSYFSGLFVDEDGLLRVVDPSVTNETLLPCCSCCTHTFNGKPFLRRYEERALIIEHSEDKA